MFDFDYKKKIADNLGINDIHLLDSIVGENELCHLLKELNEQNFTPGVRLDENCVDSFDYSNIANGTFCVNLHVHTSYSDGVCDVETILDDALKLAQNSKKNFFLLGITDHDTISSLYDVLKIIINNAEKYKKLKIALGIEFSTVGTNFVNQNETIDIHTIFYALDPFDFQLVNFISEKQRLKFELANSVLSELQKKLSVLLNSLKITLTLDEAKKIHPMITKGQDEVSHPLKKYIYGKILFSHYVENNSEILEKLKKYNIPSDLLSYEKPVQKYKKMFNNERYFYIYKEALEKYLNFLTNNEENIVLEEIPSKIIDYLLIGKKICEHNHPTIGYVQKQFSEFTQTLDFLSNQEFGLISIAHPARLKMKNISDNKTQFFEEFWSIYKKYGKNKAICYEKYYQSYDSPKQFSCLDVINSTADKSSFLFTGGIDSHGNNVIKRSSYY